MKNFSIPQQTLTLVPVIVFLFLLNHPPLEQSCKTYCNPVYIDYTYGNVQTRLETRLGMSYRSGAGPAVVPFRDGYYLFATRSQGYWISEDLREWEFLRPQNWYFPDSKAPGARPLNDSPFIALASPAGWQKVIITDDPKAGTWQGVASLLTDLSPVRDPEYYFLVEAFNPNGISERRDVYDGR